MSFCFSRISVLLGVAPKLDIALWMGHMLDLSIYLYFLFVTRIDPNGLSIIPLFFFFLKYVSCEFD